MVGVVQGNPHMIALLDADGRARHPRRRAHARPLWSEDPEGLELAWVDLLLDLDHLKVDLDLVGIPVAVEVATERHRPRRRARDGRLIPRPWARMTCGTAATIATAKRRRQHPFHSDFLLW